MNFQKYFVVLPGGCLLLLSIPAAIAETDSPEVIQRYEQILAGSPEPGTSFEKIYQYYLEGGGLEKLDARWKERIEARDKDAANYAVLRGMLAERRGLAAVAKESYDAAAVLKPDDFRVWSASADFLAGQGKLKEAAAALQKALGLAAPSARKMDLYRKLATVQQRAFDTEGAEQTLRKLSSEFPDDPFALEELGQSLMRAGKLDEARTTFEALGKLAGQDTFRRVSAAIRVAEIDEAQNKYEGAVKRYEELLSDTGSESWLNRELRRLIDDVYRRQDDLPGLVAYYERRLKSTPKDVVAQIQLSDVLFELNRKEDALKNLRQAAVLAPDRTDLRLKLAQRLREMERYDESVKILKELSQANPEDVAYSEQLGDLYWLLFTVNKQNPDRDAAIAAWSRLAPEKSADPVRMLRLADILREHELNDAAGVQFQRALQASPENADIRERVTLFLRGIGKKAEAESVLAGMVQGDRAKSSNFLRLATLRKRWDENSAALAAVEEGLKKEPKSYDLLAFKWSLLTTEKKWEAASALYEPLLAASPNEYFIDDIDQRQLQVLRELQRLEKTRDELAAALDQKKTLNENQFRLLIRCALQTNDQGHAKRAVELAGTQFSQSVPLARIEVDYHKSTGDTEARVKTLRRLIVLQPKRTSDWLKEIALAYRDVQKWDEAIAVAQERITLSPESSDTHLLASDLNFAAGREEPAIAKLKQAIRFSDSPNELRLRLARYFMDYGKPQEAISVYEEAFEAEKDINRRLTLMKPLTEAYLRQGRLNELVEKFRRRQSGETGGSRYALYLSEIFSQTQDFTSARKELARVVGDRNKDPNLLRQMVRLATAEGNPGETVRYQKQLTDLEPSAENKTALAEAYVTNGETEPALLWIRRNQTEFLNNAEQLRSLVTKAPDPEFAKNMADMFQKELQSRKDDWKGRMALAEFQIISGDLVSAQKILWDIVSMEGPPSPAPQPAPPIANTSMMPIRTFLNSRGGMGSLYGTAVAMRLNNSYVYREAASQLLRKSEGSPNRYPRSTYSRTYQGAPPPVSDFDMTRDSAVVYLGMIAMQKEQVNEFIRELKTRQDARHDNPTERMTAYALLDASDLLLAELERYLEQSAPDKDTDAFCIVMLTRLTQNPKPEIQQRVLAGLDKLYQRASSSDPKVTLQMSYMRYEFLMRAGKTEEAKKVAQKIISLTDLSDINQLPMAINLAIQAADFDKALELYDQIVKLNAASAQPNPSFEMGYGLSICQQLMNIPEKKPRAMEILRGLFAKFFPATEKEADAQSKTYSVYGYNMPRSVRTGMRPGSAINITGLMEQGSGPTPNDFMNVMRLQMLNQYFSLFKNQDAIPEVMAVLDEKEKTVPDAVKIYPRLTRVYVMWLQNKKDEAIQLMAALRQGQENFSLLQTHAGLLSRNKKGAEALALLETVPAEAADNHTLARFQMLFIAKEMSNKAKQQEIADYLSGLQLPAELSALLQNELNNLGMEQKARQVAKTARAAQPVRRPQDRMREMAEELSRMNSEKDADKVVPLARRILSENPLQQQGMEYLRRQAMDSLKRVGQLKPYLDEMTKELEQTPMSLRLNLLLAEGWQQENPDKSISYYRKAIALRPRDFNLQRTLAGQLTTRDRAMEAVEVYDGLLLNDPGATLSQDPASLLQTYRKAKRSEELMKTLLALKTPSYNPQMGYSPMANAYWQMGRELKEQKQPEMMVQLWLKGIEMSPNAEPQMRKELMSALLELKRLDDVVNQAETALFPVERQETTLFSTQLSQQTPLLAFFQISTDGRKVSAPVLEFLDMVDQAKGLPRIRERTRKELAKSDSDVLLQSLDLLLRIRTRDPSVLKGLPEFLTKPSPIRNNGAQPGQLLRLIATDLRAWPEAAPVAWKALNEVKQILDKNPQNVWERLPIRQDLLLMAIQENNPQNIRTAIVDVGALLIEQASQPNQSLQLDQALECLDTMVRYRLVEDSAPLLEAVKTSSALRQNESYRSRIQSLEDEIELLNGKISRIQSSAWVDSVSADGTVKVRYEIGPVAGTRASGEFRAVVKGREYDKLKDRFQVELLFGSDPEDMERLALIEKSGNCGTWQGKLPQPFGFLRTIVRDNQKPGRLSIGNILPIAGTPNLLSNSTFIQKDDEIAGWVARPAGAIRKMDGGPVAGGTYVQLDPNSQNQGEYISEKIPLEDGRDYLISAWLSRNRNNGSVDIGYRYMDADGKTLNTNWCPSNNGYDQWGWQGRWITRQKQYHNRWEQLPQKAASLQVVVRVSGQGDLYGLQLAKFPTNSKPVADEN